MEKLVYEGARDICKNIPTIDNIETIRTKPGNGSA
jgi:hypothetical protein